MSVQGLPDRTVTNMVTFMDKLRGLHAQDPLAFEVRTARRFRHRGPAPQRRSC
jgi:hypothetical protein